MIDLSGHKNCFEIDSKRQKVVVCKDKSNMSEYRLYNNSDYSICKIKIDEGVFKSEDGRKCDYLISSEKDETKFLFLIELKGKQVLKAVSQLNDSLTKLNITKTSGNKIFDRIVPTGTHSPDIQSTPYKKLIDRFKSLNGDLICRTKNEDII